MTFFGYRNYIDDTIYLENISLQWQHNIFMKLNFREYFTNALLEQFTCTATCATIFDNSIQWITIEQRRMTFDKVLKLLVTIAYRAVDIRTVINYVVVQILLTLTAD